EEIAVKALQKGAASYVPKRQLAKELVPTIQNILEVTLGENETPAALDWLVQTESIFVLDNDIATIPPLVSYLQANLLRLRIVDETALIQVGVALREAIVNAVIHGNLEVSSSLREESGNAFMDLVEARRRQLPYSARRVRVISRETRQEVTYVVVDEGP